MVLSRGGVLWSNGIASQRQDKLILMITSLPKFRHESHLDLGDGDDIIVLVETYKYSPRSKDDVITRSHWSIPEHELQSF